MYYYEGGAIEFFDDDYSFNDKQREDRFIRIGLSNKMKILIIVFSEREETLIRIISARRATKNESRIYEERI